MKAVQQDMTSGSPMKIILSFTFPIFLGNVFQQFYNMADAVIVGKFVGTGALAAVGSTGTIMFLIYGFVVGMTAGFTVLTAQKFSAGILAQMLYNLLASILRALGNSRVPLYFLILSALLNIVLDLVLIIFFHMGTAGAAVATVISQGVSGLLCLGYIVKAVPALRLRREDWHLSGSLLGIQLRIGIPMALQYSITAIGTMMVQSSLNILGSTLVAAFTAASKIEQVVTQAYVAMGTTMATYGAQNMGAGNVARIRSGFKSCTIIGVIYSCIAAALVMTVGKYMTYLFVSEDAASIMGSVDIYLKCVGAFFIPLTIVNVYRNGIQGLGYGILPMMAGVAELAGRGIVAVIAAGQKSYTGVCLASPAAWVLASALLIGMYFYIVKIDIKKIFRGKNPEPNALGEVQ